MRQQRKRVVSVLVMLFFLCLLLGETTYYQYKAVSNVPPQNQTETVVKTPDSVLHLIEQFQPRQTLNSRAILSHLLRNMPERLRVGAAFLVLIILAAFTIEIKRWEQEQSSCQFQTYFQNILNILHRWDGKKDVLFLCNY